MLVFQQYYVLFASLPCTNEAGTMCNAKNSTSSSTNLVVISWRWSKDGRVFGSSFQQSIIIWYLPIKRIWNMEIVLEDLEYLRDVKSRNITHKVWLKHKHKRNHNSSDGTHTFSSPGAALLLVSIKISNGLWTDSIFRAFAAYSRLILSQPHLLDLPGILWIEDFWCWLGPEVAIPFCDQKERDLWRREWTKTQE